MVDQIDGESSVPEGNFFDQFDDQRSEASITEAPRPSYSERFFLNAEAATRQGTVVGALRDVSRPENRERFDSRYESFPEWDTPMEGLAALTGQVVGTIVDAERGTPNLENLIPVGIGEKAVVWSGRTLAALKSRLFAGAIDAAATNAVTDPIIQGVEMSAGFRETFDPVQFASSVALGAVAGGVMGPITHRAKPEDHLAGGLTDWARDQQFAEPVRQADMLASSVRSEPMETPQLSPDLPEGTKLDFGDAARATGAKRTVAASEEHSGPTALGDRLQAKPERPETQTMAQKPDTEPLWKDNGTWNETDPDILEVGQFGPVIDIEAHNRDWKSVVDRLSQMDAGEARGALDHPEIGKIDVIWGWYDPEIDKGIGLSKIVTKHPEVLQDLPEIIRNGEIDPTSGKRIILLTEDKRSIIALDYMGEEKTWLLSSYQDLKHGKGKSQRGGKSILRSTDHQPDVSSGSLAEPNIPPKEGKFKKSQRDKDSMARPVSLQEDTSSSSLAGNRRAEGSTERPDSRQMDTHSSSTSSADQSMDLSGIYDKSDPELQAAISAAETDGDQLQARLGRMAGELRRNRDGVERHAADGEHSAAGQRLQAIAEKLYKLTGVAAVRPGIKMPLGVRKSGVMGTHNTRTGVIRLKDPEDFEVIAHEVGHHIDKRLGKNFRTLMVLHSMELEDMAPPGYPQELWLTEGFAEFFRNFLANPNYAAKHAPRFNKAFTNYLKVHKPDWLKGFGELQDAYYAWRTMPSGEAVSASIVTSKIDGAIGQTIEEVKTSGIGQTIGDKLHNAYTSFMDGKHPIQQAVSELAKVYRSNTGKTLDLKVKDDPYKLARMMNGAKSAGHMDLMYGVHGYHQMEPEGPSFRDAIIYAHGGGNVLSKWDEALVQDFGTYLWSRRALGEWDRFEAGDIPNTPDKFTKGDHEVVVREMEAKHQHFQQAAEMVYGWNRLLWKKKRDAGLISQEQYREGFGIRDYVPGLRKQDYPGNTRTEGKGVRTGKQNQINRFQGSGLDVINPLESLMMDAYETAVAISHNDMIRSLKRLGDMAGHGAGAIVEEVPAREIRSMMIDPIEAVEAAAKQRGFTKAEFSIVRDALEATIGEEKARLFRPEVISENGQPIVFYRDGGTLRALRLADGKLGQQLYSSFTMMNNIERNMLLDIMAGSASMMRFGITAAPEFIAANIIRDQAMAAIFYGHPFKRLKATFEGGMDEFFSRDAARHYNAMGGIMGGENVASLRDGALSRDLKALEKKGYITSKLANPVTHPYQFAKGLASLTEVSETATRIGLFRSFVDEAKLRGLDDFEASMEAAWLARDYIDFDRRGLQMVALSRIIPFLNASLQGLDKTTRLMITPFAKKYFGGILTAEEERALPQAKAAWARLSVLAMAGMGLHALMSQYDDYHEISETTRATHWMVKTGNKWTAIPKPFELATVLNIAEAAYDGIIDKDPTASERYLNGLFEVLLPPNVMESNPLVKTYFEFKSNKDFYTDADIVPEYLRGLEPQLQYTAATSELSKQIGDILGWSPALTDKMITNFTGGLGRSALSLYDAFGSNKPGQSVDDMAILRRFIKSASRGSRSIREFWSLVAPSTGEFEGAVKSYQAMLDAGDKVEASDYLGTLGEEQRVYLTSRFMEGKSAQAKKLHPLDRARRVVRAISQLRKDLADDDVSGSEGPLGSIPRNDRGAMVDILESLAVKESRNALVLLDQPGWQHRGLMEVDGHYRELEALNPKILKVLADRYASAGVVPFETVRKNWPDYRKRLLEDGSDAPMADFAAMAKHERELDGDKIKRPPKAVVPGVGN
nr:LPD38 domain-containing protein [uncultured Cohaesibacter sp.]